MVKLPLEELAGEALAPRRARLRLAAPGRAHPRVELARIEAARRSTPRRPRSARRSARGGRDPPAVRPGRTGPAAAGGAVEELAGDLSAHA